MKAIGHLYGGGSTASDSFGEGPGTVAGDELDRGLAFKPGGQAVRCAIWQQVDDFVRLKIDEDGAEDVALALRPVIDTQRYDRLDFR